MLADQHRPKGERRHLTILFSDLVGSTRLSEEMDPEDFRDLVMMSRELCCASVTACGGKVGKFMGDGILAYFGYPEALERAEQHAVNAGLDMIRKMRSATWPDGLELQLRVGIHAGLVIVGDMGAPGEHLEMEAIMGAAANVASRVQTCAAPDTVVISSDVEKAVAGQFRVTSLGRKHLKGMREPMEIFEVQEALSSSAQVERLTGAVPRRLVGREAESALLERRWTEAAGGQARAVAIFGEAGIGKSRLVAELKNLVERSGAPLLELQGTPYQINTPFFPWIEWLRALVAGRGREDAEEGLEALLSECGVDDPLGPLLLGEMLGVPGSSEKLQPSLAPEGRKPRLLRVLTGLAAGRARGGPMLIFCNDAHWLDGSTLEWMRQCAADLPPRSLLVLTSRPGLEPPPAPLEVLELKSLSPEAAADLAREVAGGRALPREVLDYIATSAAGVPFFIEELTHHLIHSDALKEHPTHYELLSWTREHETPRALSELLLARLDRLGAAKKTAQICAVVGGAQSAGLIAELDGGMTPAEVERDLEHLVRGGILLREADGRSCSFRHALLQTVVYGSLLKSTRGRYHQRVAELLAAGEAAHQDAALMAEHFTLAGMPDRAVPLWLEAATTAVRRSAYMEAIALAGRGLELLGQLGNPAALREAEVILTNVMGTAFMATRGLGSPEAAAAFARAKDLLDDVTNPLVQFPVLWGLWVSRLMTGDLSAARIFADRMVALGASAGVPAISVEGLWTSGVVIFWQGEIAEARRRMEEAVRLYQPEHHATAHLLGQDPAVAARVYLGQVLCFSGEVGEAQRVVEEGLAMARELRHPHSIAWALGGVTMQCLVRGDAAATLALGEEALSYCMEHAHHFWLFSTMVMVGWAKVHAGRVEEGLQQAREGIAAYQRTGSRLVVSVFCSIVADACMTAGLLTEAAEWVARGLKLAEENTEYATMPALLMQQGQLLLMQGPQHAPEAIGKLQAARDLAASQGSHFRQQQAEGALTMIAAAAAAAPA